MKHNTFLILILFTFCILVFSFCDSNKIVKDKKGKKYKVVKIGRHYWMAENLNYPTDKNSWCYGDDPENCEKFGRLYTWETACNVCPEGWRLPTVEEWQEMLDTLKLQLIKNKKSEYSEEDLINYLTSEKEWHKTSKSAAENVFSPNNNSGFSALPGGYRYYDGKYYNLGKTGFWWTSSKTPYADDWYRYLYHISSYSIDKDFVGMWFGASVRCIKDSIE